MIGHTKSVMGAEEAVDVSHSHNAKLIPFFDGLMTYLFLNEKQIQERISRIFTKIDM